MTCTGFFKTCRKVIQFYETLSSKTLEFLLSLANRVSFKLEDAVIFHFWIVLQPENCSFDLDIHPPLRFLEENSQWSWIYLFPM